MGRIYGYCRISRKEQSIDRQIRNIKKEYEAAVIVEEAFTGTQMNRPKWNKLYKTVESGDTIVFDSVSRMSRDAEEGFRVYEDLYNQGVNLVFLKEGHINTETYKRALEAGVKLTGTNVDFILEGVNKFLMSLAREQIRLAFGQAEKEVADLHQRTKEGIETARLAGKQIGLKKGSRITVKKKAPAMEKIKKNAKCFGGTLSDGDCMKLAGLSRVTYYKYKKELKEQEQ